MAFPIVEQIAQAVETRLKNLTLANGYSFDAAVKRRTRLGGFAPADGALVLVQGQREFLPELSGDGATRLVAWRQHFGVVLYAIDSDKALVPVDQTINLRQAETEKVLATPASGDWVKFEGTALDAEFGEPVSFVDGQFSGAILDLAVTYRTPENDPFTLA